MNVKFLFKVQHKNSIHTIPLRKTGAFSEISNKNLGYLGQKWTHFKNQIFQGTAETLVGMQVLSEHYIRVFSERVFVMFRPTLNGHKNKVVYLHSCTKWH